MPTHPERDRANNELPRWAATARRPLIARAATRKARMFRLLGQRPGNETEHVTDVVRQRVLREYHDANLARARRACEELVRAGFNTGTVPYGYRAKRVQISSTGRRSRTRLVVEPVEAAVVTMIFTWRNIDRLTYDEIRYRLTSSRYPPPLDTTTGQQRAWTSAAVRTILSNPKYTGYQVWGRRHHGRPMPAATWVWSAARAHPPLISQEQFALANHAADSQ